MYDIVFVVDEDELLHRRPNAVREERLRRLELKAMVEEIQDAEQGDIDALGIRRTSRNNHIYGTDSYRHVPQKDG